MFQMKYGLLWTVASMAPVNSVISISVLGAGHENTLGLHSETAFYVSEALR